MFDVRIGGKFSSQNVDLLKGVEGNTVLENLVTCVNFCAKEYVIYRNYHNWVELELF